MNRAALVGSGPRRLWVGGPTALPLGVGAWAWGDTGYWGYGQSYGQDDVRAAYEASRVAGLTLVDTAEVYGRGESERLVGRLVHEDPTGIDVAVATKFVPLPWRVGRRSAVRSALAASLARLHRPRVELYQIHGPLGPGTDRVWLRELAAAYDRGEIGAVGVSNYGPAKMRAAHRVLADEGVPLATNQVQWSLLARRPETSGLVETCAELGVTVIAYSPIGQGLLSGKYTREHRPPGVRGIRFAARAGQVSRVVAALEEVGRAHGRKPAQVALAWLVAKGAVPIPGAKNADQATANAGGVGWDLEAAEVDALDALGTGRR